MKAVASERRRFGYPHFHPAVDGGFKGLNTEISL